VHLDGFIIRTTSQCLFISRKSTQLPRDICYQLSSIAVSPLSVRDSRIYGPSSCYKPISTTPTRRNRCNHLSNLSAAKLVAKWMTLHFGDKRATDISKSPQVNGILFKSVYELILNTSHGKDSCTFTVLYLLRSAGCGVYQPAPILNR